MTNRTILEVNALVKQLTKGELHVHLNGLISTEIVNEIIKNEKVSVPSNYNPLTSLNHFHRCSSLKEYLKPWEILRLVPTTRASLNLIVENAFQQLLADNVLFAELRNSIIYIARNNNVSVSEALKWLTDDISEWSEKTHIEAGLILTISRSEHSKTDLEILLQAYEELGCPETVVGLDIAGDEDIIIDPSIADLLKFAKEKFNLGITIHAGETGNLQNVKDAVNLYYADRIGHGTVAGESIEVMRLLRERDVCVEVCPISNLLTNAVPVSIRHPVYQFLQQDVPFVLCSDNPGIHSKSLSDDYLAYYLETSDFSKLEEMLILQKKYSFLFRK